MCIVCEFCPCVIIYKGKAGKKKKKENDSESQVMMYDDPEDDIRKSGGE